MFKSEGTYQVTITKAELAEPKFAPPPAFDVCLQVTGDDGQSDWWRGEVSSAYGKGNAKDRTQAQLTMETLRRVGYQGQDLSQIGSLVGVKTTATVVATEKNGKTYHNVRYLGDAGDAPVAIDPQTIAQRIAAIFGGQAPAPQAMPQQFAQPQQQQGWPQHVAMPQQFQQPAQAPMGFPGAAQAMGGMANPFGR